MDSIELNLKRLLEGAALRDSNAAFCDYSLQDQIDELTARGIESQVDPNYEPIVKETVTYIVAAVLVNDRNEVLMMQEAKKECAGSWYLPAGRMEPGEDILEAVKREVIEETGISFEPTALIMVQSAQGNWYRFVFTGNVTGGILKTVAQADQESLQASWIDNINQLSLRAKDVIPLIELGKLFKKERSRFHKDLLPAIHAHKKLFLRLVVVTRKRENNRVHVLVSEREGAHFPVCEINPTRSVHSALKKFMQAIFGAETSPQHRPHGCLSLEHSGLPIQHQDGFCLSILLSCKEPLEHSPPNTGYTWLEVEPEIERQLVNRLSKEQTVALNIIR